MGIALLKMALAIVLYFGTIAFLYWGIVQLGFDDDIYDFISKYTIG